MPSFKIIGLSVLEKVFSIYGHGGRLGHLTLNNLYTVSFPLPRRCHLKFGEKMLENNGQTHVHVYSPGAGADSPCHKIGQSQPRVIIYNEKRGNKQCLLDTPAGQQSITRVGPMVL